MSIVSSTTKFDNRTQQNGRRGVQYELTDHVGDVHMVGYQKLKSYVNRPVSPDGQFTTVFDETDGESYKWDGGAWQLYRDEIVSQQETSLNEREGSKLIGKIQEEVNILDDVLNPTHSTSKILAKKLIRYMMRENDSKIVLTLEPLIIHLRANYTNPQLITFLDITAGQATKMNTRINAVLDNQVLVFDVFEANSEVIE